MTSNSSVFSKPSMQLFLIVGLCLVSTLVFSLLGIRIAVMAYDFNVNTLNNVFISTPKDIEGLKIVQLFSAVGFFIIPPIIYSRLVFKNIFSNFRLNVKTTSWNYSLLIVLMFISFPLLSFNAD